MGNRIIKGIIPPAWEVIDVNVVHTFVQSLREETDICTWAYTHMETNIGRLTTGSSIIAQLICEENTYRYLPALPQREVHSPYNLVSPGRYGGEIISQCSERLFFTTDIS